MAPTEQQAKQAKAQQLAGKKTPNARVQRYLKSTAPQLKEGGKNVLLLKGMKTSANMMAVLKELRALQAPAAKLLTKKNPITVFDDFAGQQSLEFLMTKNDCSVFAMATHNKKRPNNFVLGRTFDRQLLDTAELGVTYFKSMHDYGGSVAKKRIGSKPVLLFQGDLWQQKAEYRNLQNLLTDFYRGDVVDKLVATGIDHIIVFTAAEDNRTVTPSAAPIIRIHQRTYHVQLKKNPVAGAKTPAAYLTASGPDMDFVLRRTAWAAPELAAAARKQPFAVKRSAVKKKNQSTNLFGETIGKLHLDKQNVDKMGGRKAKALRRAEQAEKQEERAAVEQELEREQQEIAQEFKNAFGFEQPMESDAAVGKKKKRSKA
jgi:ribosome production factor 2